MVIALDTPSRLAAGISHGFRPYGPPTMVTRAEGPVAAELEYEPAFPVYQRTARARGDEVTAEPFPPSPSPTRWEFPAPTAST